jgi:uncharacterized protein (DUF4415 family)
MEKKAQYQVVTSAPKAQFHLRLPDNLLEWYRQQAVQERRKINAVMIAALEAYRAAKEIEIK